MKWIAPPDGRPWALIGLCTASLVINTCLLAMVFWQDGPSAEQPSAPVIPEVVQLPMEPAALPEDAGIARAGEPEPQEDLVDRVRGSVTHSLARTFQEAVPEQADVVSAVYARLFAWDLDLRRDLQRGDEVAVAYDWEDDLARVQVATYASRKLGKTLHAYRFLSTGDTWASYWDDRGTEVGRRLVNGPLRTYEQVTSLLKDRPRHRGMDFKTAVGTPVHSPRAGVVTRTDWNLGPNGNCIEVKFTDGTLARFLHLSEVAVSAGNTIAAGSRIGSTGNTGRSTAPHLHYELERSGRIIDPVDYHGVTRRQLPEVDLSRFSSERVRLDDLLSVEGTAMLSD